MFHLAGMDAFGCDPRIKSNHDNMSTTFPASSSFGVSDVWFLAVYSGFLTIFPTDEIVELTARQAQLKSGQCLTLDVLVKCLGFTPDNKMSKVLGLQELRGFWVNSDLRKFVLAFNGAPPTIRMPSFWNVSNQFVTAISLEVHLYLLDHPEEFEAFVKLIPSHDNHSQTPSYLAATLLKTFSLSTWRIPYEIKEKIAAASSAVPTTNFLTELENDWIHYSKLLKLDEPPPYPFSEKDLEDLQMWDSQDGVLFHTGIAFTTGFDECVGRHIMGGFPQFVTDLACYHLSSNPDLHDKELRNKYYA